MRERHKQGPGYTKVDYKANEYTDGYTSAGDCNSSRHCYCNCGHCAVEDHRFCGHSNCCHVGCG